MKKNILFLLAFVMLALTSCEDPQYVAPTAERQGLTSLTAIFTSGPFVDQQMGKLEIGDEIPDRLVIPIPYYYPVTSDDETEQYMTRVRVQAALGANCFISPALTILDLTKDNEFTFTDAKGVSKKIIITGERVKSSACELLSFSLTEPEFTGIIDKATKKVSIITIEDISSATAVAEVSPHATISPDPAEARSYNEPVVFTVTAHDGTTAEYTVMKDEPEKIDAGFNRESVELLFNFDPVASLGMPAFDVAVGPTLAALKGKLVICAGDGTAPIYVNALNGAKQGQINLGAAVCNAITNDEAEHLLIINHTEAHETANIYRANSVTDVPVLFKSFLNDCALPLGSKIKCIGNIDSDALIIIPNEGVDGVTTSSQYTMIQVQGGVAGEPQIIDIAATGYGWGSAPVNTAGICARTTNPLDGIFISKYEPSRLDHIAPDGTMSGGMTSDLTGWGLNPNCLDSKKFNNVNYLALFVVSHFPAWGMGPQLYLYNVNNLANFTGDDVASCPCLELANGAIDWYQTGSFSIASGDVVIAPSADGFNLRIYYYDHNSQVVGGYSADCIKR